MGRFVFEPATDQHDAELRRLLAENEMEGDIRISFRREPSYFLASNLLGSFCQVVAARDTGSGKIIGVGTRSVRAGFINGKVESLGYLADLRLDPRYRGGPLVARAYRHLRALHQDGRAKLYFTVIAEGNRLALETIASGRAGLPPYCDYGRLLSPAINLLRRKAPFVTDVQIRRGSRNQLSEIVHCLNRNHQRRQLAPYTTMDDFISSADPSRENGEAGASGAWLRDFRVEDFYVALRDHRVIGVLGKWDQNGYKQTVITGYRGTLRFLRPLYNLGAALTGGASYPPPGRPLHSFYASFIAVDNDDVEVFRALLRQLYNDQVGTSYHYFVLGLHEKDPLCAALLDYSLTSFAARLFLVHFDDGEELFKSLDAGRTPYIEAALL
ncbi:MAG: hypothetical protein ACREQA_21780 [Candidatus Binatia bacterium]